MARTDRQLNQEALRDLIEGGGAPFKSTGRSWVLWCPKQDCGRQKLYVEKTTGASKCFRCGFKGFADYVLAEVYGKRQDDLGELLYGFVSSRIIDVKVNARPDFWGEEVAEDALLQTAPKYPPEISPDPGWVDARSTPGQDYLVKRGVPPELFDEYGIKFNPAEQRVIFPAVVDGVLRGWQGRYIHPTTVMRGNKEIKIPKAITEGRLSKDCFIFQDRLKGRQTAVLTEGPMDAIKCHSIGGNVASMGKDISPQQLDILVRAGIKKLYVGLDRNAGLEVEGVLRRLNGTIHMHRLLPPDHREDLGDCTFEEAKAQAEVAEEMFVGRIYTIREMPDYLK